MDTNMLTVNKLDASVKFSDAFMKNVEENGLENTMIQFKALANVYSDKSIEITPKENN